MPDRQDPRVRRTRARALAAAYELLLERGFGHVTMDEVSARARVAKSTLYQHWSSRDDLLREAFSQHALAGSASGSDLHAALLGYALAFAEGLERAWGRAAATLAVAALDDPEQRQAQLVFVRGYRRDLDDLVCAAVDRGEIERGDGASEVLERLIAALFYRYLFAEERLTVGYVELEVEHAIRQLR